MEKIQTMPGLPFLNMMRTQNQNQTEESEQEKKEINKLYEQYSKELLDKEELVKNFESYSDELIKMGYNPKIILRSFLVHKYSCLEEGLEILSKTEDLWNHRYIDVLDKCFICGEFEYNHRSMKNMLMKKSSILVDDEKIKIALVKQRSTMGYDSNEHKSNKIIISSNSCPICFIEITENEVISLSCKHEFCKDCIIYYLEEEIKNARVKKIKCPQKACDDSNLFSEDQIKSLVTPEVFDKYQKFLQRELIKEQKNTIQCPIVDCEGFAVKLENEPKNLVSENQNDNLISQGPIDMDNPNQRLLEEKEEKEHQNNSKDVILNISSEKEKIKYVCNKGHPFCGRCKNIWHEDNCNEDKAVKDFATTSGKMIKKCGNCRVWTEKNEGCNHMTCQVCKYEWCWLCENQCPPNHYTLPGPCYGRQFNDIPDPLVTRMIEIENEGGILYNTFFVFYYTQFLLSMIIRSAIENNQNQNNQENGNRPRPRFSKVSLFFAITLVSFLILICTLLANGVLVTYMIKNLPKMAQVNNALSRILCVLTFMVLFVPLYFIGMLISVVWFLFIVLFTLIKLCSV